MRVSCKVDVRVTVDGVFNLGVACGGLSKYCKQSPTIDGVHIMGTLSLTAAGSTDCTWTFLCSSCVGSILDGGAICRCKDCSKKCCPTSPGVWPGIPTAACIHICVYTYIYIRIYIYIFTYRYSAVIHTYIYICSTYKYKYKYVHMFVYLFFFTYLFIRIYIYTYICLFMCTCVSRRVYTCIYIYICVHTWMFRSASYIYIYLIYIYTYRILNKAPKMIPATRHPLRTMPGFEGKSLFLESRGRQLHRQ